MAYTYRLCVTDDPTNRIPFTRPEGYTAADYEVHARLAAAASAPTVDIARNMFNPAPMVRSRDPRYNKYDLNSSLTLSTDLTADDLNHTYVEAPQARRQEIQRIYRRYIQGLLYALQTEPRFGRPARARVAVRLLRRRVHGQWRLAAPVLRPRRAADGRRLRDERERRDAERPPRADPRPVALGTYSLAAHSHRYLAAPVQWPDGERKDAVVLEGALIGRLPNDAPYPISYRALTPRGGRAQPAESGDPVGDQRRLQLDPHGAHLHDAGRSGRRRGRAGRRVERERAGRGLSAAAPTADGERTAGGAVINPRRRSEDSVNEVAAELIRAATRQFGDGVFTIEPNDEDPQADPGSVVLAFPHPRRLRHRAAVIQRGNAFEVAYSDGGAIGPAEALFVFADAGLRRDAIEDVLGFLDRLFTGRVVVYRERIGAVVTWLRRDEGRSVLRFGTREDIASRTREAIDAVHDWRAE